MSRKPIVVALVSAAGAGAVAAVVLGDEQALSLRVWLAGSAIWLTFILVRELHEQVPIIASRLLPQFGSVETPLRSSSRLGQLRSLDFLLLRACDNHRTFDKQLRPRLNAVAAHFLQLHHGIDVDADPQRAQELLAPVGWIIDPSQTERKPRVDELEQFVALVTNATPAHDLKNEGIE